MKSLVEIAQAVRRGELRALDVVEDALARLKQRDAAINAFVWVDEPAALRCAADIDRSVAQGKDPGPLAGVPIGVKDNERCAGMPTRHGSLVYKDNLPEREDSPHVGRLRRAGAIPIGKVAMSEFGLDGVTDTRAHGTTRNPWRLERTPGGSSGGSAAAVSAGIVSLCTGSDALGSIRCPAGFTGLVGLKPSHGRVSRENGFRDTAALGALTTTVTDTARYLDVAAGPDDRDRMSLPAPLVSYEVEVETLQLQGRRAAWSPDLGYAPVEPEIIHLCELALRRLAAAAGLDVAEHPFHCTNVYEEWNALAALDIRAEFERLGVLPDHIETISRGPRAFIESSIDLTPATQAQYRAQLRQLESEVAELFLTVDVLFTPTACCEAYPAQGPLPTVIAGRDASRTHGEPFTALGSICWNPSISIPAGVTSNGLPVGLLMTGRRHKDEVLLRLARIWETLMPWPRCAPAYAQ